MVRIDAERGEVVLRQGELLRGMYVVASGRCSCRADLSIDGAPPPSPLSPPPGLDADDDDDDDDADAAAAAAPASRVARVFVRTMARREVSATWRCCCRARCSSEPARARDGDGGGGDDGLLPTEERGARRRARPQRAARGASPLLAPSDASLRKAYIDDIEWAEAKRQSVERPRSPRRMSGRPQLLGGRG